MRLGLRLVRTCVAHRSLAMPCGVYSRAVSNGINRAKVSWSNGINRAGPLHSPKSARLANRPDKSVVGVGPSSVGVGPSSVGVNPC